MTGSLVKLCIWACCVHEHWHRPAFCSCFSLRTIFLTPTNDYSGTSSSPFFFFYSLPVLAKCGFAVHSQLQAERSPIQQNDGSKKSEAKESETPHSPRLVLIWYRILTTQLYLSYDGNLVPPHHRSWTSIWASKMATTSAVAAFHPEILAVVSPSCSLCLTLVMRRPGFWSSMVLMYMSKSCFRSSVGGGG